MKTPRLLIATIAVVVVTGGLPATAQNSSRRTPTNEVSPAQQIEGTRRGRRGPRPDPGPVDQRSINGSNNNLADPEQNAAETQLLRSAPSDYGDGISSLAGADRPGAREVSNGVNRQTELVPTPFATSDYLWQWGQFVDHDIDLTDGTDPPEAAHILVPAGDPEFDPAATGTALIPLNRSIFDLATGTDVTNPREQLNGLSGWIDGSNVYGSDEERALALRTLDGTGRLATSPGDLLPDDDGTQANATGGSNQLLFLAGDVRANEQVALTALHTLFVREHNRLADEIRQADPTLDGEAVYQRARRLVGAILQVITYEEFLPALLGPNAIGRYRGYNPAVDARIRNEFSTAAYRFGHSALPPMLLRLDENMEEARDGHLALRDAFFAPDRLRNEGGIEPLLRGLAAQVHQRIDVYVIDDVRNFLFGPPGAGGFDLPALNIQRGRDHGIASYNDTLEAYGLSRASDFTDVSSDPEVQARLADTYASVDDIDLWVGGLAEDAFGRSQVGPLVHAILAEQFRLLRDGDRFWYENALGRRERAAVRNTRLSDVIRRNTTIAGEIPDNVFRVRTPGTTPLRDRDRRGRRGARSR